MTTPPATAEMERLVLLVSALRRENEVAHQLLGSYRRLFSSTREVLNRRLPLHVTKARLTNTCDKATIAVMVAKLDKLEKIYSPHKAPTDAEERVRGLSPAEQVDVLGPGQERGRTHGSLRVEEDVLGPGQERGRTHGSLRVEERSCPPPYPAVDGDNVARLSVVRGSLGLSLPHPTSLPVLACDPGPNYPRNQTYNPMGGRYTPPTAHATREPFGLIEGFRTNLGPVSFPRGPVKGYIWDREHSWVLHACPPGLRRRGARGSRR